MDPQTTRVVGMICFPFHDEFPWNSVCSLGPPSWVCFAPPDTDRTSTCTLKCLQELDRRLQTLMDGGDQALTLFKPSCVNAKPILKPINMLPVFLIRFSMQRILRGVQRVCFPTFIGQLHSLCIFKIFHQGFSLFFCKGWWFGGCSPAHSSFGGGIASGWQGKGLRCGVWWGQPRSQQGICVLHLPLQSEHSYCTSEQLSGVSSDGRM